jgi:hypothetical protein
MWGPYETGSVRGPQKLNDASGKTVYAGTIDGGFPLLLIVNAVRNVAQSECCCSILCTYIHYGIYVKGPRK